MQYTVQDEKTGKKITFEWNGKDKPNQKDLEQIFSEANTMSSSFSDSFNNPKGLIEKGNIDIHNRKISKNNDNSISTVRSISINSDGKEYLIPTIGPNGEKWSNKKAIENFKKTGMHLGAFDDEKNATAYAEALHKQQEKEYLNYNAAQQKQPGFLKRTISNIPSSAARLGKDTLSFVTNPKQNATALGQIASGGVQAAMAEDGAYNPAIAKFESVKDFYKNRYGGLENIKETVATDPVGAGADLAGILMAGGGLARLGGAGAKLGALERVGMATQKAGAAIEPVSLAMRGVGMAGKAIPKAIPRKMFSSAAKFSTALNDAERARLTETALKNKITPTVSGVNKVNNQISEINKKISGMIDKSVITKDSRMLNVNELFNDFESLRKEAMANSAKPMDEVRQINRIEKQVREANKILERENLSPADAQKLKQGIYKDIGKYYSQFNNSPASAKAQKSIARAAKEYIEDIIPEIKQLNQQEGELIELRDAIQKSANRISNRDIFGIGMPIKGTAGGAVGGVPGAAAGIVIGVLDTPGVKSKLAIALEKLRSKGIKPKNISAAARLGLVGVSRAVKDNDEKEKDIRPSKSYRITPIQVGNANEIDLRQYLRSNQDGK
jgi:hypothetical protein